MELGALLIVNANADPIVSEGPDGGFSADKGPVSLVRIHKYEKPYGMLVLLKYFR